MNQGEKEIYAQIFKTALMISAHKEYAEFAENIMGSVELIESGEVKPTLDHIWETLKEYADIKPDEEERWKNLIDGEDAFGKGKDRFTRRLIASVIKELERRSV